MLNINNVQTALHLKKKLDEVTDLRETAWQEYLHYDNMAQQLITQLTDLGVAVFEKREK